MKHFWTIALFSLLFFPACRDKVIDEPEPEVDFAHGVFLLNEGNFNRGNASLTFFSESGDELHSVFSEHNAGLPLGDVAQAIYLFENDLFVVVNNSGKVLRIDGQTMELKSSLSGLVSPRYLAFVSAEKAYATDLYADAVTVFNPRTAQVRGQIAVGAWTEAIEMVGGMAYACQMGTDKLLRIDPATDLLTDSIYIGREPNSMAVDGNGKIWILCSGGIGEVEPRLVRFDPVLNAVEQTFDFTDINQSPDNLSIDPTGQKLYFLNGDVFQMDISANALPTDPLIPAAGRQFYHLEVGPVDGDLWVSDAVDFVQEGALFQFGENGALKRQYSAGIIPGDLLIRP